MVRIRPRHNESQHRTYLIIPRPIVSMTSMMSDSLSHLFQKDIGLRSEVVKALSKNRFVVNIEKALRFGYVPKETADIIRAI
jgi:hypothetical protein